MFFFFFQAEDGIRDATVTGVQTCALPIFAEVVCPPGIRAGRRADQVLREFGLLLGALPPAARKALAVALVLLDQGARLYPPSRGRRFARLDDQVAGAYVQAEE